MTDSRKDDPLKQPLLGREEVFPSPGPVCQSPGLEGYPSHPSSADHSRHSIPQDEEQAEPLLPKSKPSAGPAYDSLTPFSSHPQHATCNVASSSMQPGQGIPQPDGSVLPISVTHDITSLPSNQFNVHEGFPPQQSTTAAGPAPQTTSAHTSQPYDSHLPLLTATTPEAGYAPPIPPKGGATVGPAPECSSYLTHIPPKGGATAGPAPERSSYLTHIPPKGGATVGPAPEKRSMANWQSSSAVPGPAPQYTNPCGPYDPVMSTQPQPMSPQPMSPPPMSLQPMSPPPMSPQPMSPQPMFPQPMSPPPMSPPPMSPPPMSPPPMSPPPIFPHQTSPQPIFPQPQPAIPYPPPQPIPPQPVFPQPPTVQYLPNQQPRPLPAFPPRQYQPYQPVHPPQSSNATAAQVPTTPYVPYRDQTQQGGVVQQFISPHAVKTSFKFDAKTLCDNQFYVAICLLISVTVCINPLGLTCTIPALIYAHKAAQANKQDSHVEALKYHKKARICNIATSGAFITAAVYSAILVFVVISYVVIV